MLLIGIISFLLAIFSLLISIYFRSISKRDIKGLRYYEIWKKRNRSYFIIFNRSELYITKNDVYKDLIIDLGEKNNTRLYYYKVLFAFADSNVEFKRKGNQIQLCIDYIKPRSFAVLEIKSNSRSYFIIKGILENGKIIKYNYKTMRVFYHSITRFLIYELSTILIFYTIVFSLLYFDKIDKEEFENALQISFVLSMVLGLFIYEKISFLRGLDIKSLKLINKMIHQEELTIREKTKIVRKRYLKRRIKNYISKISSVTSRFFAAIPFVLSAITSFDEATGISDLQP